MDYEKLKETYNKNGTSYKLVKRNDLAALYQQFNDMNEPIGYEVFVVKVQPAFTFPNGIVNKSKESFPSNENFGKSAWAYGRRENALKRFEEITNGQVRPEREETVEDKPVIDPNAPKRGRGRPRKNPNAPIVPYVKKGRKTFVYEGKEYKSKAEVGRILLTAGEGKVAIAKKLKCSQQSVHGWWVSLNPNAVKKRRKA